MEIGRILRECIRKTGRKSDMMTQYDGLTFLLLLIGVGESECWMIADRILRRFRENCPFKKVRCEFSDHPPEEAGAVIGSPASHGWRCGVRDGTRYSGLRDLL